MNHNTKEIAVDLLPQGPRSLKEGDRFATVEAYINDSKGSVVLVPNAARRLLFRVWTLNNSDLIAREYEKVKHLPFSNTMGDAKEYWHDRLQMSLAMQGKQNSYSWNFEVGEITKVSKNRLWTNGHNEKFDWAYSLRSTPVGEFWVRRDQQIGGTFNALVAVDQLDCDVLQNDFEVWACEYWSVEKHKTYELIGHTARSIGKHDDLVWLEELIIPTVTASGSAASQHVGITYSLNDTFFDIKVHNERTVAVR